MTRSGIDVLGEVWTGTHVSILYDSPQDLCEILTPYFLTALEDNEFCLWIVPDSLDASLALQFLKTSFSGRRFPENRIHVLSRQDWESAGKSTVLHEILRLPGASDQSPPNDPFPVRIACDASCPPGVTEPALDSPGESIPYSITVCTYSLKQSPANVIVRTIMDHMATLIKKDRWQFLGSGTIRPHPLATPSMVRSDVLQELVIEHMDHVVYYVDVSQDPFEGRLQFLSPQCTSVTGHTPDEFVSDPKLWSRLIHPKDVPHVVQVTKSALESGRPATRVYRIRNDADGKFRRMEDTIVPRVTGDGKTIGMFGVARDITGKAIAEASLKETEERFRMALRDSSIVVFQQDLDLRYTWIFNPHLGYTVDAVLGKTDFELLSFEDASHLTEIKREVLESGVPARREVQITSQGATYYYDLAVDPLRDSANRIIGVTCVSVDVTSRIETERRLRDSEDRYRDLVEHSHDLICTHDLEGKILSLNALPAKILGLEQDDLTGKNIRDFLAPDVKEQFDDYISEIREKGRANGLVRTQTSGGEKRIWEYSNTLRTEGVAYPIVRGIARDVTERVVIQKALKIRTRQQEAVARFGQEALNIKEHRELIDTAVTLVSRTLEVEFSSILELLPDEKNLLLRAGTGWKEGLVGHAQVSAMPGSQAAYTLAAGEPTIANDLRFETRFTTSPLLKDHEIAGSMSVVIAAGHRAFGILGAHSSEIRDFTENDTNFLQSVANVLADGIRRLDAETRVGFQASLLDQVRNAVIATDMEGRITYWNKFAETLYQWKKNEVIGKNILEVTVPPSGQNAATEILEAIQKYGFWEGEFSVQRKDGTIFPAFVRDCVIHNERGCPIGLVGVSVDISERKLALKTLQESEERFRAQFMGLSVPTYTWKWTGEDFVLIDFNQSALDITKGRVVEFLGVAAGELYRNRPDILNDFKECLGKRKTVRREMTYRFQSTGEEKQLIVSYVFIPPDLVMIHTEDITERRKAEEELQIRLKLERLMAGISASFIGLGSAQIDEGINSALQSIGEFARVDRSYVLLLSTDHSEFMEVHEWCASGIEPIITRPEGLPTRSFQWCLGRLKDSDCLRIPRVADLPVEAAVEREYLQRKGIQSFLCVPMNYEGALIGVLGFDSVRAERSWGEDTVTLLRIVGDTFASALQRKRAEEVLQQTQERFSRILDIAPEAIISAGEDQRIVLFNKGAERIFGHMSREMIGQPLDILIPDRYASTHRTQVAEFSASDLKVRRMGERREIVGRRKNGEEFPAEASISKVRESAGKILTVILRDITERKQAEEAIRKSEEEYRTLIESMSEGLVRTDNDNVIQFANDRFCEMTGYARGEVLGKFAYALLIREQDQDYVREKIEQRKMGISDHYEVMMKKKTGDLIWVKVAGSPLRDVQGRVIGSITVLTDITRRKEAEETLRASREQLRILSQRLIRAQETERRHVASELHDEIGQSLTALRINLHAMNRLPVDEARKIMEESSRMVDQLLRQVRDLSLDLRPSLLDDLGLMPAVRWYLERQSRRSGLDVNISTDTEEIPLSGDMQTTCYRVIQEAVTNVIRHAHAQRIEVAFRQEREHLELTVRDDGTGFVVQEALNRASSGKSLGLLGMQERVMLVGGEMKIESEPGKGSVIIARFPLAADEGLP